MHFHVIWQQINVLDLGQKGDPLSATCVMQLVHIVMQLVCMSTPKQ